MDLQIAGNSALVTASSDGLGKAAAQALVEEGVNVVINGRDAEKLDATATELAALGGGDVIAQPGDLLEADDLSLLVERTVDAFGGIDHLVTSAGLIGDPRRWSSERSLCHRRSLPSERPYL